MRIMEGGRVDSFHNFLQKTPTKNSPSMVGVAKFLNELALIHSRGVVDLLLPSPRFMTFLHVFFSPPGVGGLSWIASNSLIAVWFRVVCAIVLVWWISSQNGDQFYLASSRVRFHTPGSSNPLTIFRDFVHSFVSSRIWVQDTQKYLKFDIMPFLGRCPENWKHFEFRTKWWNIIEYIVWYNEI